MCEFGFTEAVDVPEIFLAADMFGEFRGQSDSAEPDGEIHLTEDLRHGSAKPTQDAVFLNSYNQASFPGRFFNSQPVPMASGRACSKRAPKYFYPVKPRRAI